MERELVGILEGLGKGRECRGWREKREEMQLNFNMFLRSP